MREPLEPGRNQAENIILVPGLDGTALLFYRQIPLLARRFNVTAFPLADESESTMDSLTEDLSRLLDELGIERAVLCGESFGGALSMSFALDYPDRVSALVIVNSFPYIRKRLQLFLGPRILRVIPWGTMRFVRRFTESRLHSRHCSREDLKEFHQRTREIGRDGYIRRLEILRDYDLRERLGEIRVPALFLAGDQDRLVPSVREARFMAERVPDASLEILRGYGHICLINHDLDLLEHIQPWYDAVASRSSAGTGPLRSRVR